MTITMNMSSYEIERDDVTRVECGDAFLYSNRMSALALVCQDYSFSASVRDMIMPSSLATVDAEVFLQKMYSSSH